MHSKHVLSESAVTGDKSVQLVDDATIEWDASKGYAYAVTLGGNRTFANPTLAAVGVVYFMAITQDATGSRTPTWGSAYRFPEGVGPDLTADANATDILVWYSDGANFNLLSVALNVAVCVPAPSSLAATSDQTGQVTLTWVNNAENASSILVQRDDGIGFLTIAEISAELQTYVNEVAPGQYIYRLKTVRNVLCSVPSDSVSGEAL